MTEITTGGVDLAESVFQVHGIDADGEVVLRRQLRRTRRSNSSRSLCPAWSAWKPVPGRIIGRAISESLHMTSG
jgi:hypothetical protein